MEKKYVVVSNWFVRLITAENGYGKICLGAMTG